MKVNFAHLRILFVKNLWLQLRNPIWLLLEMLLPLSLVTVYIFTNKFDLYPTDRPLDYSQMCHLPTRIDGNAPQVALSFKDDCCEKGLDTKGFINETFNGYINFEQYGSFDEMKKALMSKAADSSLIAGFFIEKIDLSRHTIEYKLLVDAEVINKKESDINWGDMVDIYNKKSKGNVSNIQHVIENALIKSLNGSNLNVTMGALPKAERIKTAFFLTFFYAFMPSMLLLSVVATTRNIVVERQTIQPYLSVMGLNRTVFYLSHCLVLFIKIFIFVLIMGVTAFLNFPDFPWVLAILTFFFFSLAATAFSAMLASFFNSPSTAMQMCVAMWLSMAITPQVYPPNDKFSSSMATLASFWPTYGLHFVFKYLIKCSDIGPTMEVYKGLTDSKWTNQAALGPLLMLLVDAIAMIGIAMVFDSGIASKVIFKLKKKLKITKGKPAPKVNHVEDADEAFEMDENNADICLENVFKEYGTGEKAVNGLSLKAHQGQVTVLLGHNGAGKTTTFSMICGVEDSTGGSVTICGHKAGSIASRSLIGYCAQANTLIDQMTVADHLWLIHGLKQGQGKYLEEGENLLEALGLQEFLHKKVSSLSGGQKRKLCMCMALIGGSRVILLDEPTAGMDPESRRDVEKLLEQVKKERTVLLTTHYMDEAETLGNRIFIVAAGQTVCSGSPQFLKKRFGTGYVLTLVAEENRDSSSFASELTSVVQEFAPSAHLGEVRGKQVEISIPVNEQKNFPALFERLEADQTNLSICSFGLSLNSLEQVFLSVTSLTDDKSTSSRDVPLDDALRSLYSEDRRTGFTLYWAQLRAVLLKKAIYSLRFWSQLVTQIGLPIISIIVGLVLFKFAEPVQTLFLIDNQSLEDSILVQNFSNSELGTELFLFLNGKGQLVDDNQQLTDYRRSHQGEEFQYGAVFDDPLMSIQGDNSSNEKVVLLANIENSLSYSRAINSLNNARLKMISNGSITAFVETYSAMDSSALTNQALLLVLLLTIMMCQFTVTTVEDRITNFAHQQLLMGLSPVIYWAGDFIYGLFLFCFQTVVYTFSATFSGIISPNQAIIIFAMLILYYWAIIPSVFIITKLVNSSSRASLIHWLILFGSFGFLHLAPLLQTQYLGITVNVSKWNLIHMNGFELVHLILTLIFPTAAMYRMVICYVKWGNEFVPSSVRDDLFAQMLFNSGCLFVTGAASLIVFLLIQQRKIRYFVAMWTKIKRSRKYITKEKITLTDAKDSNSEEQMMLETDDLCKVYGKNCALAHLNMSVRVNECFGLLGVSGAGKTTAFNIITGQMFATQGSAFVDGTDCRKDLVLGFCPQFDAIHSDFTGKQALKILARIHGYSNPKKIADEIIEIVGMQAHANKRMKRCSGGQRRRISVAASLLPRNSRIIILDEATAGIDPKARRDIWEVLAAVREHSAILMTSHSMDECEALCSRIGILKHGGLAAVGSSQTLKSKYGNFFTLSMALPSSKMRKEVAAAVADWFPGSVQKSDGFSLHLKWQVPKKPEDCWSSLFASCIELSEKIDVPDFCLTQSTLQDIFLLLAGENKGPKMKSKKARFSSSSTLLSSTSSTKSDE